MCVCDNRDKSSGLSGLKKIIAKDDKNIYFIYKPGGSQVNLLGKLEALKLQ